MSRIFLGHSSANNDSAIALRNWLLSQGWDDVFLDLDPRRGIAAGDRWERSLNQAALRCEAVLFLVSRAWLASDWCLKEFNLAHRLNKRLFGLLIEDIPIADLPATLTSTWQVVPLASGRDHVMLRAILPGSQNEVHVTFSQEGLTRLRIGLERAGLDAQFFAWPPEDDPRRPPYRGLLPLEAADAGIFFGREAPTIEALDRIRGIKDGAAPRLLVLLGASGAGKSSFLRAGLLPRLARDDRNYVVLPVIRPERAAINGETGLLRALETALAVHGVVMPRVAIRAAIEGGAATLRPLLQTLIARAWTALVAGDDHPKTPVLVLAIDQGEELFLTDGASESAALLNLLREMVTDDAPALLVVVTIRSDAYEQLQTAKGLEGVTQQTLSLIPMPRSAYQAVIEGPAARLKETDRPLLIEPALTQALLSDIEEGGGRDALPLLAFTLERLYLEYGGGGRLALKDYDALGRIKGSIEAAVERALAAADTDSRIPRDRDARLALLRRGLIPWLAGIDPDTGSPRRQKARMSEIPEEARPLIDLLVEQRLLSTDVAADTKEHTIEPAHESLLRQWGSLQGWLQEDFATLTTLETVKRATRDWDANAESEDWLGHRAGRLEDAERLLQRADLAGKLDSTDRAYLSACRQREDTERKERTAALERELRSQRRARVWTRRVAVLMLGLAILAGFFGFRSRQQTQLAEQSRDSERSAKNFIANVAETLQELAGFVPEETEDIMRKSTKAILAGDVRDADSMILLQVDALEGMARYFHESWDGRRAIKLITDVNERLGGISPAGAARLEFTRLAAGRLEIAGDVDADDERGYDASAREYGQSLELLDRYRLTASDDGLASARVHRKLGTLEMARGAYAIAEPHIRAARALLEKSEHTEGERASLNDLMADEATRQGDFAQAQRLLEEAVVLDRSVLSGARQSGSPIRAATVQLAMHLQHLGDARRHGCNGSAPAAYDEAQTLTTEVLETYPNQAGTRFMLDLVRHGRLMADRNQNRLRPGECPADQRTKTPSSLDRIAATGTNIDKEFGEGFGRFKFGMSTAQVNSLLNPPFVDADPLKYPRAREYSTGEVHYFWRSVAELDDFHKLYDLGPACLHPSLDYVVFMFHEDSLFRMSYRLYGPQAKQCRDRHQLFPEIAERFGIPLLGTPKQWRLRWETARVSVIGTTFADGPMIDIIAR